MRIMVPKTSPKRRYARMPSAIVPSGPCRCGYNNIYKKLGAVYCNNCGGKIL